MAKKKELEVVEEVTGEVKIVVLPQSEPKKLLGKLELDFGREDLNKMRDKINELVERS